MVEAAALALVILGAFTIVVRVVGLFLLLPDDPIIGGPPQEPQRCERRLNRLWV